MDEGVSGITGYRDFLVSAFEARKKRNPRYSQRAFARDLGIAQPRLSLILKGTQGISRKLAVVLCKKLRLIESDAKLFCDLVESEHARNRGERVLAKQRVNDFKSAQYTQLKLDNTEIFSDWIHFGILELMRTKDFRQDTKWIAMKLESSELRIIQAMNRMMRVGLLKANARGLLSENLKFSYTDSEIPNQAMRKFHKELIGKSIIAIDRYPIDQREFSTGCIAIDSSRLAEFKREIKKLWKEFAYNPDSSNTKDEVYCLSIQFYPLTSSQNH